MQIIFGPLPTCAKPFCVRQTELFFSTGCPPGPSVTYEDYEFLELYAKLQIFMATLTTTGLILQRGGESVRVLVTEFSKNQLCRIEFERVQP